MTVQEFSLMMDGYVQEREEDMIDAWNRSRWIAALLLSPHSKRGQRIKLSDIAVFPWDENKKTITKAEQEWGEMILQSWAKNKG